MPRLVLLLPAASAFAGLALPDGLARALGRADRDGAVAGEQAQLARHFELVPRRWPAAALTRLLDGDPGEAGSAAWLRADPAYLRPDINGARLLATGEALGLGQDDVDAFLPALRPLFGDAGVLLDAPRPGRWYLRLPRETKLPAFAAPEEALGDDAFEHEPRDAGDGPEARRWRRLASEAQVLLHNHPRNALRIAAGIPPVNALWFWGGGVLPDHARSANPTVYSDDPALHGLARIGNFAAMPLPPAIAPIDTDTLVDLRRARDLKGLLQGPMRTACDQPASGDVLFDFADGTRFAVRGGHRWRLWRRPMAALGA